MKTAFRIVLCVLALALRAGAEDAYFEVPLDSLKITAGRVPDGWDQPQNAWETNYRQMVPRTRLDVPGEAYLSGNWFARWRPGFDDRMQGAPMTLHVRSEAGADVSGHIELPRPDGSGMVSVSFTIPAGDAKAAAKQAFLRTKLDHYDMLLGTQGPGGAWFRHQANLVRKELGLEPGSNNANPGINRPDEYQETFGLLSGGRAISENLQLSRQLRINPTGTDLLALDKIEGITVKAFDWKPLVRDLAPKADPLSKLIPIDQHAIFFPSFAAATAVIDEADTAGTPLLEMLDPRSEDARSKERYQTQLCLSLTGLGRILGPRVINSLAVTGSDPYLRVGSDVAVIFEPRDLATLRNLLEAQLALARGAHPAAKAVSGQVDGVAYTGAISPNREVCSYLATVGNSIVVTNSLAQLGRIIAVHRQAEPSLADAPEYIFFRDRYRLGDADESALIILSDATIRRWCSPRWRIADSRRTRAAAILSEFQAQHAGEIVRNTANAGLIQPDQTDLGQVKLTPDGVVASLYGSLDFMTPIIELPISEVTRSEADAYRNWRIAYQNNWSQYFDPIAVRLSVKADRLAADLTVMPLVAHSDYADLVAVSQGAKLTPTLGDPHDALFHVELAVNRDSARMKEVGKIGEGLAHVNLLEWLGDGVGLYVDDDEDYWKSFVNIGHNDAALVNLPIALRAEVSNGLKLAGFIVAMRAMAEVSAPNQTIWEAKMHNGQAYTRIRPADKGEIAKNAPNGLALYYATMPDALVISLNEGVIQRALDRHAERAKARAAGQEPKPQGKPWLGDNLAATGQERLLEHLHPLFARSYVQQMQAKSWANLPILNEWKRLFPDQDPVKVHQRLWGTLLLDPAGGKYVWNEQLQTMESSTLGCPEQPKAPQGLPGVLSQLIAGQFGITFENSGIRARAVLERKP